jgi:hypothetical protein
LPENAKPPNDETVRELDDEELERELVKKLLETALQGGFVSPLVMNVGTTRSIISYLG